MIARGPVTAQLNQARRKVLAKDTVQEAILGDGNGQADTPEMGYHWARFPMGADENGSAIFGPKFRVRANPDVSYFADDGRRVYLQKKLGQWWIAGSSLDDLEQAGIDTRSLNANDRYRMFRYFDELVNLNSYDLKAGLKISVRELVYEVPGTPRVIKIWRGSDATTHVNLADNDFIGPGSSQTDIVPSVEDTHRYALLVFSHTRYVLGDPCLLVYPGVPISLFTELSEANLQTCYNDLPDDELLIAIKAYYLEYGQTKIAGPAWDVDVRQLINIPSMGSVVSVTITSPLGTITITETTPGNFEIEVADGAIGLPQLADGTPNTVLGFDGSGAPTTRDLDNDGTLAANSSTKIATQQAVKSYVDSVAQGLSAKRSVLAATTAALPANTYNNGASGVGATITANANGALTIDGQSPAINDRVLIKDESSASHNGIYIVTAAGSGGAPFVLTRATDFDLAAEIPGAYTFVENGTVNNAVSFIVADPGPFTIGTTAIDWTAFSRAEDIQVTAPLSKSGNTISITTPLSAAYGGLGAVASAFTGLIKMVAGVASVAVAGTDYTTPTGAETLSSKTITGGTINNTPIGGTTQAAGYFSALRLYLSGKAGIFTHANSADRTYTFQDSNGTVAFVADIPSAPSGVQINFQAFTTPGLTTWTGPGNGTTIFPFHIHVICIGGGGGGGSGRRGATGTARFGGGGGAAGNITQAEFSALEVGNAATIVVGAGGTGGAARVTNDQDGAAGAAGGLSSFSYALIATGGAGGAGGTNATGTGGTGVVAIGPNFQTYGSSGASSGVSSGIAVPGANGPGGGGAGGVISTGNVATNGGTGAGANKAYAAPTTGTGGAGGTANTAGNAGTNGTNGIVTGNDTLVAGDGGGGGAANTGVGGNGGNGGLGGGGGGGGSASLNGNASGAGGNGGDGIVLVFTYSYVK